MLRTLLITCTLICSSAVAQQLEPARPDLGFAPLPAVPKFGPIDSIFFADRLDLPPAGTISASLVSATLPASFTGTGYGEPIQYQLPDGYSELGAPYPLILAYHGFGGSAASSGNQSMVDEEANERGWIYLSVTGLDDQLFGTPLSQQNTKAAIQWMINNFNVDEDRLFMVGFSVGGGISANFAAIHRDPTDIMIAGIGLVSSTVDWAMEYNLGIPQLQTWMENPFNFSGPPSSNLFDYLSASVLYEDEASYPPTPGTIVEESSLAQNLSNLPIYMTYDVLDFILHVPHVNDDLQMNMASVGNSVLKAVVAGTVYPPDPSIMVPHSWYVLDEDALFDYFDGVSVDRYPSTFYSRQAAGTKVSYVTTTQATAGQFVNVDGDTSVPAKHITLSNVENASMVEVNVGEAGITSLPMRLTATSADDQGFRLKLTGFTSSPSRLHDFSTNALITGVDSNPSDGSLLVDVPPNSTLDVRVKHDPLWTTVLETSPNPVVAGSSISVSIDAPPSSSLTYFIVSLSELFIPVGSVTITASPLPPSFVRLFALDASGDVGFVNTVPNDPALIGLRFPTQALTLTAGQAFDSVSNLWGLYVE